MSEQAMYSGVKTIHDGLNGMVSCFFIDIFSSNYVECGRFKDFILIIKTQDQFLIAIVDEKFKGATNRVVSCCYNVGPSLRTKNGIPLK